MKRKAPLLPLFFAISIAIALLNCTKSESIKAFNELLGKYTGYITNFGNNSSSKKDLTLTITSQDNPVAGSYNLAGTTGTVTGSVLGSILNLTLKPTASGTTYTFSGNANDDNTAITGTMTGVESGTAVKYTVDLKK